VVLTERQQEVLVQLSRSRTTGKALAVRASVILLAFDGLGNQASASRLGLGRHQVGRWRRRWQRGFDRLAALECLEGRAALRRAIERALRDQPRPGCPGQFTAEQLTLLLALACEPPEKSGRPLTPWTAKELADEAQKRGLVESISPSQVNRSLRQAAWRPHKSRSWLNTHEKDPELFQAQVEMACATYHDAPQLFYQHDTHTFCVDEMTGLQALERIATTLPLKVGRVERREFEDERHGTLTLIGNFHVVTGQLVAPTLGPTRTEEDFVRHVERTVALDPAAGYVFVVDNLNSHRSASLVGWVAKACGLEEDLGTKGKRGVLKSQESRQQFLEDLSHRSRFVYLPKHTSWLNQIEVVFGIVRRKVIRRGSFTSVEDLRNTLLAFLEYFNAVFAKPFKWTYNGRPLQP
jgi:transposase